MRKNLATIKEVAQVWAKQSQQEGRTKNFYFEGEFLFSYGEHFCVARRFKEVVVITNKRNSQSTNNHISLALSAARSLKVVRCRNPAGSLWSNKDTTKELIMQALADAALPRIRQPRRDRSNAAALRLAKEFNEYLKAVRAECDVPAFTDPFETSSAEALRESFIIQDFIKRIES